MDGQDPNAKMRKKKVREDRILFLPKLLYSAVLYNCVTAELFVHVHRNVEDKQHFLCGFLYMIQLLNRTETL